MLDDPINLRVVAPTGATAAVAISGAGSSTFSFERIGVGPTSANYRYTVSSSHYIDMFVGRQVGKSRTRYTVRLTERELVADPINSDLNSVNTATAYIVADVGVLGTTTNWAKMLHGLATFLYDPTDDVQYFDDVLRGNV